MVSSSGNKNNDVDGAEKHLSKSTRPLLKFKFYLDVRNRVAATKLETKIKGLGGALELFLAKEVTHFITDREGWTSSKGGGTIPQTPPHKANDLFNSPANSPNTTTPCRPKSRADAMLQNVRRSSTVPSKDPLDDALRWGIKILTVERAVIWLNNLAQASAEKKKKQPVFFELKEPFIKFESYSRNSRPIFRQIHNWPTLNFLGSALEPALITRSPVERNMTRKTRSHQSRNDTAHRPGYCEVCRIEYLKLDQHLESEKHLKFVRDNGNFLGLDNLINDGTNFESFLKANCIIDANCVDSEYCAPLTRNKMPRTRINSQCTKMKNSPLSPAGSDVATPRLRPRNSIANSYIQHFDDLEDELRLEDMMPIRELRSSARQSSMQVNNVDKAKELAELESDTWSSGRPKRSCLKGKRISADERLVVDNKTYYKVEVLSSKLRSSDYIPRLTESPRKVQTPIPEEKEEEEQDKGLIVKFKRMRTSELLQLNNEAENFLFPRKDDSGTDTDIDGDGPNTTVSTQKGDSSALLSSEDESPVKESKIKNEMIDDSSMDTNCSSTSTNHRRKTRGKSEDSNDSNNRKKGRRSSIDSSCSTDTQGGHRKKRRTHAEAFILDNQKYYKFETPGSRLRYHGSLLAPIPSLKSPKNGECVNHTRKVEVKEVVTEKKEDKEEERESKINLEEIRFSFEQVPRSEPWYETFQRQDRGDVYYSSFSESGYFWKPLLLPYEMGPIPPLDPRLCISAYQHLKKQLLEPLSASTSAGSNTPDHNCTDSVDSNNTEDVCSSHNEDSNLTNDGNAEGSEVNGKGTMRIRRRKGILLPSKNPRKSPRQHASTLAILSSLLQQRKRRSRNSESPQKTNLPTIQENEKSAVEEKPALPEKPTLEIAAQENGSEVPKEIQEIFNTTLDIDDEIDVPSDREIVFHSSPDAIAILEEYEQRKLEDIKTGFSNKNYLNGKKPFPRKPGRKRKNLTGWPKATTKRVRNKKEPSKEGGSPKESANVSEDENCQTTDDNSITKTSKVRKNKKVEQSEVNSSADDQSSNVNNSVDTKNSKQSDKEDRVTRCSDRVVDLEKWENAEKVLSAKLTNTDLLTNEQFQPYVVVQKLDSDIAIKHGTKRARSSSSPHRTSVKKSRRMPASPKSPRALRKPRGRWYRER